MKRRLIETRCSPAVDALLAPLYASQGIARRRKPVYRLRTERPARFHPSVEGVTEIDGKNEYARVSWGNDEDSAHKKKGEISPHVVGRKITLLKCSLPRLMPRFEEAAAEGRSVDVVQFAGKRTLTYQIGKQPKACRATCGAKTRAGGECKARCVDGMNRCRNHGGLSTGAKTEEGRARISAAVIASNQRRAELRRQVEGYAAAVSEHSDIKKETPPKPRKLKDPAAEPKAGTWNRPQPRRSAGKALADRLLADAIAEVFRT